MFDIVLNLSGVFNCFRKKKAINIDLKSIRTSGATNEVKVKLICREIYRSYNANVIFINIFVDGQLTSVYNTGLDLLNSQHYTVSSYPFYHNNKLVGTIGYGECHNIVTPENFETVLNYLGVLLAPGASDSL
jgi:hypothetical protein